MAILPMTYLSEKHATIYHIHSMPENLPEKMVFKKKRHHNGYKATNPSTAVVFLTIS